jgi:thymidylate kinase
MYVPGMALLVREAKTSDRDLRQLAASVRRERITWLLEHLDAAGVPLTVLHGYGEPAFGASDVDCVTPVKDIPAAIAAALRDTGCALVQHLEHEHGSHYFVIDMCPEGGGDERFLALDVASDYRRNGRVFFSASDLTASATNDSRGRVAAAPIEFAYYLVKKVAKGELAPLHGQRLSALYRHDPDGCDRQLARFWPAGSIQELQNAARSGNWEHVQASLPRLRHELLVVSNGATGLETAGFRIADLRRLIRRIVHPAGLHVVFLGSDGAGKSTVIARIAHELAPVFRNTSMQHFSPELFPGTGASVPVTTPHAQAPRSRVASIAKVAKWLVDFSIGHVVADRLRLIRANLLLYDRYLPDVLIDPRRYRYGGPEWLIHLVCRVVPKPDLVIGLDAPAEILQARKQEISPAESERQRDAYRTLVRSLRNGRVVDASQPLDDVVAAVNQIILEHLSARAARRLQRSAWR